MVYSECYWHAAIDTFYNALNFSKLFIITNFVIKIFCYFQGKFNNKTLRFSKSFCVANCLPALLLFITHLISACCILLQITY